MAGPFYNLIRGTTSGAPGTGAFTPNAAASGFVAWSAVPTGWIGLVKYDDGTSWELTYSYWNGTTLSRGANQLMESSSGSLLNLSSAATATMIANADRIGCDMISSPPRGVVAIAASSTVPTAIGAATFSPNGTIGGAAFGNTSYLARQPRVLYTSATTANAQAGLSTSNVFAQTSSTAGIGGWAFGCRFGCSALPTGPRVFVGMTGTNFATNANEPSALTAHFAVLGKDSTDTNLQIMVNSNAGTATKIDTGIVLAAGAWYEIQLWSDPGSLTINYLLIRWDTGGIFFGSTATDVPSASVNLIPNALTGLSGTTGTAIVMNIGHILVRPVI